MNYDSWSWKRWAVFYKNSGERVRSAVPSFQKGVDTYYSQHDQRVFRFAEGLEMFRNLSVMVRRNMAVLVPFCLPCRRNMVASLHSSLLDTKAKRL